MMRIMIWIALRIGRPAAFVALHVSTAYFVVFSLESRRASRGYLTRVLARRPGWRDLYRHLWTFSCSLLDRVYILAGRTRVLEVEVHADPVAHEWLEGERGCVVLSAHLGSFEALRLVGARRGSIDVRPMMFRECPQAIDRLFRELNESLWEDVISVGREHSLLQAQEAVDAGVSVGILGDRVVPGGRTVACEFLGDTIAIPAGPYLVAKALDVPIVLCFALHNGWGRYTVYVEAFADRIRFSRDERDDALRVWAQRYADRLESYCRLAPYNWFNFYDIWAAQSVDPARADPEPCNGRR